eukprot:CAMPEP_0202764422 /NCGR_PEP_ID=MMETSP1388-20130828/25816_1 /ASSEMBLY_ACC=CAM_ASM_000864 /TAXON_ID=37098 /ORGANISM="Isochrysis sp, Strain CCMP1244" /LENGTH=299 /DNA_ID=CAMNT_0049432887 /DNA_START=10 /DNA_END=909 /DNA_ORIENTATION=+
MRVRRLVLRPVAAAAAAVSAATAAAASTSASTTASPPPILYGTAWKRERTCELVLAALRAGFRGIDTACQPKHYDEAAVGAALETSGLRRADLYVQTKYTPLAGQDPDRLPYDAAAEVEEQVKHSVAASLRNLRTDYLDCLLLHSPLPSHEQTLRAWRQMEAHVAAGEARALGLSNQYDAAALERLCEEASVKPSVVQNRFVEEHGRHDVAVRAVCERHGVRYQAFWALTGNRRILQGRAVREVAKAHGASAEQVWLSFVQALGITPLSGTTDPNHMAQDLALPALSAAEVERLQHLIG